VKYRGFAWFSPDADGDICHCVDLSARANIRYNARAEVTIMTVIAIGSPAPGFTLNDQNGKKVSLGKLRGRRVILSFRPLAWTPVCHD
jgi:peroxiredoxin